MEAASNGRKRKPIEWVVLRVQQFADDGGVTDAIVEAGRTMATSKREAIRKVCVGSDGTVIYSPPFRAFPAAKWDAVEAPTPKVTTSLSW